APLLPVEITVAPSPDIDLKYFLQRDVFSDNPFTADVVEPSEPFFLGLKLDNVGAGVANNERVTTGQPEVIRQDADRNIIIDFDLIGTQLAKVDTPLSGLAPSFKVAFGDIEPGDAAVALFQLISSIEGQFIDYNASYEYINPLNDPSISAFQPPEIFELRRVVNAQNGVVDDLLPDFVTNELPDPPFDTPDTIHLSDGSIEPVTYLADATIASAFDSETSTATVTVPGFGGWSYITIPDPTDGARRLIGAERSDGTVLDDLNFWQTDRTFVIADEPPLRERRVQIFDWTGPEGFVSETTYTLTFVSDVTPPGVVRWWSVKDHGGGVGEVPIPVGPGGLTTGQFNDGDPTDPRGSIDTIRVFMDEPIDPTTLSAATLVTDGRMLSGVRFQPPLASEADISDDGRTITYRFDTPLAAGARYCLELTALRDLAGNFVGGVSTRIKLDLIPGDVLEDQRVNVGDIAYLRRYLNEPVNPFNAATARSDVNADGVVDGVDFALVRDALGTDVRGVATPCFDIADGGGLVLGGPPLPEPDGPDGPRSLGDDKNRGDVDGTVLADLSGTSGGFGGAASLDGGSDDGNSDPSADDAGDDSYAEAIAHVFEGVEARLADDTLVVLSHRDPAEIAA
ncbi:MAG: dockerin type I domain-containing protein, partial [Planctomycetota bacterium]